MNTTTLALARSPVVDPPAAAEVTTLSTTDAARYCGMTPNMFKRRATLYGLIPVRDMPRIKLWAAHDVYRLAAIRREAGRQYQNISLDRAAQLIAVRKTGYRHALEAQIKQLLQDGVASGTLDLTGLEKDGEEVMRRVYRYLLFDAGDWIPVEG